MTLDARAAPACVPLRQLDQDALLRLNNAHATELSWLDSERLAEMLGMARHAIGVAPMQAALIAFDQDSPYRGMHFAWFRRLLPRFVYVDRIVVAPEARGRGLARLLYGHLFEAVGSGTVACEVNLDPPNPASDAFHAALGFREVGRATLPDGSKTVRYLARDLP